MDDWGSIPGRGRDFFVTVTRPALGVTNLLYSGYQGPFPCE